MHIKNHENVDIQREISVKFSYMPSQWGDKKVTPTQYKKVCEGSGL
jgi:hypothetical protein